MIRSRRQRRTAWLATLAMWLVCVMPVVSQIHAARDAWTMDVTCSAAMGQGEDARRPSMPDGQPQSMEKCGYCFLAAHSPAMPGVAVALLAPQALVADTFAVQPARVSAKPSVSTASPRGPPVASLQS